MPTMSTDICIDVCIASFKRPDDLGLLLDSLIQQRLNYIGMRIIVIDNDRQGSAQTMVQQKILQQNHAPNPIPITYAIEPLQGISYARNHALDLATAPYVAFLDDDEFVEPDWLHNLFTTMMRFQADVAEGKLIKLLPNNAATWLQKNPIYRCNEQTNGKILPYCGAGNVLFSVAALGNPPLRFDPRFAHTGGEDTAFFSQLYQNGKKIITCQEAIAYEHVPTERLKLRWLLKRYYRGGQVSYRVFMANTGTLAKTAYFLRQLVILFSCLLLLPVLPVLSSPTAVQFLCKMSTALGKMSAFGGQHFLYQEYQDKHYRH